MWVYQSLLTLPQCTIHTCSITLEVCVLTKHDAKCLVELNWQANAIDYKICIRLLICSKKKLFSSMPETFVNGWDWKKWIIDFVERRKAFAWVAIFFWSNCKEQHGGYVDAHAAIMNVDLEKWLWYCLVINWKNEREKKSHQIK